MNKKMSFIKKASLKKRGDRFSSLSLKLLLMILAFLLVVPFSVFRSQAQIAVNGSIEYQGDQKILNLWGTNYERGYAHGYLLADEIMYVFEEYFVKVSLHDSESQFDLWAERTTHFYFAPEYDQELQGMLQGMIDSGEDIYVDLKNRDLNLLDLKMWNALRAIIACSSFAVWDEASTTGETIDARSFDTGEVVYTYLTKYTFLMTVETADPSQPDWAGVTSPGLIGPVSGVNEYGVTVTANKAPDAEEHVGGYQYVPPTLLLRGSLDQADDIDPIGDIYNYLVNSEKTRGLIIHVSFPYQGTSDSSVVFETDYYETVIRHSDYDFPEYEHIIATNHFVEHQGVIPPTPGSLSRYNFIANSLIDKYGTGDGKVDPSEAWDIIAQVGGPTTLHTILFQPNGMSFDLSIAKVISEDPFEAIPAHQVNPEHYSWSDLFPNHEEDVTPPVISDVQTNNITGSSATITWMTDEGSDSLVNYGPSTSLGSTESDPTMTTNHSIVLTGLAAQTTYYYEVQSTDSSGNTAVDNNGGIYYSFATLEPDLESPIITGATGNTSGTTGEAVTISATITDNVGVVAATVYYTPIDGVETEEAMTEGPSDLWSADVPVALDKVGTITYYIVARDASDNQAREPVTGAYEITVTDNDAPIAEAGSDQSVLVDEVVSFDGSSSSDNIGITSYNWDFDASDGIQVDATGVTTSHTYGTAGDYTVTLTVDDAASNGPVSDTLLVSVTEEPVETIEFEDSFEVIAGQWVQDSQNDWFVSTQRATDGSYSAEVDGSATDATLSLVNPIDLTGKTSASLTFSWLIESGLDSGEYLCLDLYDGTDWLEYKCLQGNVDPENVWHNENIDLSAYIVDNFNIQFRAKMSYYNEDANVDDVNITSYGIPIEDTTPPIVMLESPADGATDTDGDVIFEYIPNDVDSGIASCELVINGVVASTEYIITEGIINQFPKTGMENGQYTWNVNCTDDSPNANVGSGIARTLIISTDTEPPTITNATGDTSSTTGEPVTIEAIITDNVDVTSATVHYTPIDGTETATLMIEGVNDVWSADIPVASDKVGTITYYITAQDAAENTARNPATGTYSITVTDNDAPSTITDLTATAVAGGKIELVWSAATDNIGVASYNVYRAAEEITDLAGLSPIATGVIDTSYTDAATDDGKTYYYAVTGVDEASNEGEVSNSPGATADATAPTISGVTASNIADSSATITWTTDEASDTMVRYGTDTSLGSEASDATMVQSHSVTLTELSAGTMYYYEVESTDAAGNTATDDNGGAYFTFTTTSPDTEAPVITGATGNTTGTTGEPVTIFATITDNVDVVSATVHYTPIDGVETEVAMTEGASDVWSAEIPVASDKVGTITYYLVARDAADNEARDPATGTYEITVTDNDAPTAEAGPDQSVLVDVLVTFDGSSSSDNMGITSYSWDFDASDGIQVDATGVTASHTYETAGDYTVTLTVDDAAGNGPVSDTLTVAVSAEPVETIEFDDSFEDGTLDKWVQDSQNDWFVSTQRATDGSYSAEVDGSATDATLSLVNPIDLTGKTSASLTFSWLIERGLDSGEYLCLDLYDGTDWLEHKCLQGNVDPENVWHNENVDLSAYMVANFNIRFKAKISRSNEDANVDKVTIISVK